MKQLVINGDDFGMTAGINRGIVEAFGNGLLTSTSLMANGPAFDDAVALARQCPGLAVGIHVTLTAGHPLSEAKSMTGATGEFHPLGRQVWRLTRGAIGMGELSAEIRAQAERLVAAGIRISHFDTHHNIHLHPLVAAALRKVARAMDVRWIRFQHQKPILPPLLGEAGLVKTVDRLDHLAALVGYASSTVDCDLMRAWLGRGAPRPELPPRWLVGTPALPEVSARQFLGAMIEWMGEGIVEWACHPGYVDDELRAAAPPKYVSRREDELRLLADPATRELLASNRIAITNYAELAG